MNRYSGLLILLTLLLHQCCFADDVRSHIYRLEIQRENNQVIECTGFKIVGRPGIFTALHGVLDGRVSAILPDANAPLRLEVKLTHADFANDVAYLAPSSSDEKLREGGLNPGIHMDFNELKGAKLSVIGFPVNIDLLAPETSLRVRDRPILALEEVLNPQTRASIALRSSPSLEASVLNLEGNLLPGHSGAPIFNESGVVIGLASGGLERGRVGHCFAIPLPEVRLKSVGELEVAEKLVALRKRPIDSNLFCVIDDAAKRRAVAHSILTETVVQSDDGSPVRIHSKLPSEGIKTGINLLQKTLQDLKAGAPPVEPEDAIQAMFTEMGFWIPNGSRVEVIAVDGNASAPADPMHALQGFLKDKAGGEALKALGAAADTMNVKVKVLDGADAGKEGWVYSGAVKRTTRFVAE